jgi:hypothetical protein
VPGAGRFRITNEEVNLPALSIHPLVGGLAVDALAAAPLEDKIVQGALVMVLNAVYEEHFLGFSYGFRPGRGPHDALDALAAGIDVRKVNFVVDADIRGFFDSVKIGSSDSWNTASATGASSASSANGWGRVSSRMGP